MTEMLRAAVIGLGVGEQHIAGYEADPRCQVVALCDTDAAKLAEVGARHRGKRLTGDPTALLAEPGIDVVSIASYDDAHHAQVVAALETGKHVFVEKPICLTAEELADIRGRLAVRPYQRLSSNLILRRAPRFAWLRDQVRAGALGAPYYLE
ncbi:MAG: Gfo/Idh/MocA family oxidoreductase, partial [Stellaceae bacterium]